MDTGKKQWSGILVCLEWSEDKFHPVSFELLGTAVRLSKISREPIYAVGIGAGIHAGVEELKHCGAEKIILCQTQMEFQAKEYAEIISRYIEELHPGTVLIGGTLEGRSLSPRLAAHFKTGLTADCTGLDMDESGRLIQVRPAFGGNLMAQIVTETARPQFATVRPFVMKPEISEGEEPDFRLDVREDTKGSMHILAKEKICRTDAITDAGILVAAGRGIKKKEDLKMLRELADLLGGKLACSRALVELGWMRPEEQIGLSGNTVCPDYLITCGISGTVQFMAGMKTAKHIIAVNTDPNARIFQIAHEPICGDLYEIVPALIQLCKKNE